MTPGLSVAVLFLSALLVAAPLAAQSRCPKGCHVALASYYVWEGVNLTDIATAFNVDISMIVAYNQDKIPNAESLRSGIRINVPFRCDCLYHSFLGHRFVHRTRAGDTYDGIAMTWYSNLTTSAWLQVFNSYPEDNIPENAPLNVTVNCSCGNGAVSKEYGLFMTYPLREEETLQTVADSANMSADIIQSYNPGVDFSRGSVQLVYIPGRDLSGNYPAFRSSKGFSGGIVAGISIGGVIMVLGLAFVIYPRIYRKKEVKQAIAPLRAPELSPKTGGEGASGFTGITIDKSVEFTFEELANATDNFSLANMIGKGGFGAVYYAELRGKVRLIGYCVEGSLFLVYEYLENGNLSEHLRGSDRESLPWSTRVQIALDSARGLEYIHEHTVPSYIHRDIKSANILIDRDFHGKVADFGLTKVGHRSRLRKLMGTFGYMPPEYQSGHVSAKVDVYAFGVVLYELISAKEAVVTENGPVDEAKTLVALFEEVLNQPDPKEEDICKLVDPSLGNNYPLDSILKMALLAKLCTQKNPQLRPSMRSVMVALMNLSSAT